MAQELARTVHVRDPRTNKLRTFGPGDPVPDWAAKQITNPAAWADDTETAQAAPEPSPEPAPEPASEPEQGPPAKSASKAEWKAYAVSQGIDEADADAATRDDLADRFLGD